MKRVLVLALAAPLILIGAAYPEAAKLAAGPEAPGQASAPTTYRPCRPGPGDDRCIQLYERGVRASYARWLRGHGPAPTQVAAVGGPVESAHPPRPHHDGGDHRCPPSAGHDGEARGM